ncbi:MAG: nucleotidyltransferase [Deltaproteobacteria bacterium CG_4_10_14_0_2_um_filter_43_8]|nr:MAG: nucleotidyltransferase [Deltaproteobacteria bacterium CG11_big_fil_rev_8_21_14_0_20_42_23]PJA21625.1 MAG: nucleotidyltransferase [Deltaproteobacteria bacterium CG_4_10_14_0_2_um_filter_43_8]PJC65267.1 MAG: nucleotidyltransferase [Deltaproteobacteria bacterium CG_4_9_14_0_2_um_filter_42_21]
MTKKEVYYSFDQFKKALLRLDEAVTLASDGDELKRDGTIQRFEFTFELMWKMLKIFLRFEGKETTTPRTTLKEAFKQQMLNDDEEAFLAMIDDRNLSSHTYNAKTVENIFEKIKTIYLPALKRLEKEMGKRVDMS